MPAEREHRPEVVALGGVVVDDVEDHLDPGAVQRLHHPLELAHLLAVRAGRGVERVRREIADRAVAPVVREAAVVRGSPRRRCGGSAAARPRSRRASWRYAIAGSEARPAYVPRRSSRTSRVQLREALDVRLVDDGLVPRASRAAGRPPSRSAGRRRRTSGSRRRRPRRRRRGRRPRSRSGTYGRTFAASQSTGAVDRLRVRVDQELGRVEAVPGRRVVRAVDAVAVALARARRPGGSSAS